VTAPITGRASRAEITQGNLVVVGPGGGPLLTTVVSLDPIYVDVQQSAQQLLALRQRLSSGAVNKPTDATAHVLLPDGSVYPQPGTLQFSEVLVDESTGTVTLRIRVPNPDGLLLPGMFVRARIDQAMQTAAYRVPQAALVRGPTGNAFAWVVGPGDRAVQRALTADRADGADWIVTAGLNPGDRVITQGIASLHPDTAVRPVPASTPQRLSPPDAKSAPAKQG